LPDGRPGRTAIADAYINLLSEELGDEEVKRQAEAADGIGSPRPGGIGDPPQECPVCGYETLVVVATDDFGYNLGAGTCAVCAYTRSPSLLYWLGVDAEYERSMAKD
jgi:hypothetical protein